MPIRQWLYFDSLECLSEEGDFMLTEEECAPVSILSKSCIISKHRHPIVVVNPFFPSSSEKLPIRWSDCSVWQKHAGNTCQTALLPGE